MSCPNSAKAANSGRGEFFDFLALPPKVHEPSRKGFAMKMLLHILRAIVSTIAGAPSSHGDTAGVSPDMTGVFDPWG